MIAEVYGSGIGVRRGSTTRMLLVKQLNFINSDSVTGANNEVYGKGQKLERGNEDRILEAKLLKIIVASSTGGGSFNENYGQGTTPTRRSTYRQLQGKIILALP
jgi:hypothetical protein